MKEWLIERIRKKEAQIAIVGLGYVGLPTAAIFADAGFKVFGADIDGKVVKNVSSGRSHINEPGLNEMVSKVVNRKRLEATTSTARATEKADIVIICVQTGITEDKKPYLKVLEKACERIGKALSKEKLVIVESTVPPGTMRNVVKPILEKTSKLHCGEDFWLATCPERIAPGKALKEFVKNVRIVGGYDKSSEDIAAELFKTVVKGKVLTAKCTAAEVAKLAENTFRDVNIAFANELALICEQIGVDVKDIIELANTHPRVNIHNPGCGVGGPCLPKDPYLLLHSAIEKGFQSSIIVNSRRLNDHMAKHVVKLIVKSLKNTGKEAADARVVVLGTAYKGGVDDTRNSSAGLMIKELISLGARPVVYDPYSEKAFGAEKAADVYEALKDADCLIIATDHEPFKKLNLQKVKMLMHEKAIMIDGRRLFNPLEVENAGLIYIGVGGVNMIISKNQWSPPGSRQSSRVSGSKSRYAE